ncbi:hypothetical protein PybrP1_007581 [[Pythium] brassicae (nom. inval.)]|nr:hypothetical protein PybrP1_007581 [[Pythium] brassicae (nom. inval.)]
MGDSLAFTIIQLCGILAAVGLFASPAPDLLRIHRTRRIGEVSVVPLISLFGSGYIWSIYGLFMDDIFPVVITNAIGVLAATIYTSIYFYHTTEKRYVGKLLAGVGLALAAVTLYSLLAVGGVTNQTHKEAGKIVGFLAVAVNIILFASPFETVVHIVRTKNASSLPITLCFVAMINCTLWVLYGVIDNDMFVLTPNALGFIFSVVQDEGMVFTKLKSPAAGVEPLRAGNE